MQMLLPQRLRRQGRVEQRHPGQQLVQEHPERVQIGRRPQPATDVLLGSHVLRGPDPRARGRRRPGENLRDPEIGDFQQVGGVEQDVVRFDVTVQHTPVVRAGQRRGHRQPDRAGTLARHPGPPTGQRPPASNSITIRYRPSAST